MVVSYCVILSQMPHAAKSPQIDSAEEGRGGGGRCNANGN